MKINKLALVAGILASGLCAGAAERTVTWTTGTNPSSALDGDITFTYDSKGLIQNVTLDPGGDTIVFSGDKMNCHNADSTSSTWTFKSAGKVVFKNAFEARTMTAQTSGISTSYYDWRGYSTLLPTNGYQVIKEDANLADWEPTESYQYAEDAPGSSTLIGWWLNRALTMKVLKIVREGDRLFVQYRNAEALKDTAGSSVKHYYVAKVELKQVGDDIAARLAGGWTVYFVPGSGSVIETGTFDMDEIDIGDDKVATPARVSGTATVNGIGMNSLNLKSIGAQVLMRFEGTTDITGSPKPQNFVRMEIADASKTTKTIYAAPGGTGVLAIQNGGANWKAFASTDGSSTASVVFESTKATSSASVTNVFTLNSNIKAWNKYYVSGIDGSPAVLNVSTNISLPTNSSVTARYGGILRLSGEGVQKGASTAFIAEPGGVIEACANNVFNSTKQEVRLNGGTLMIKNNKTPLYKFYMRDGAVLDIANRSQGFRFGIDQLTDTANYDSFDAYWSIGGTYPSTNNVILEICGEKNVTNCHVFCVTKTMCGAEADFVQNGKISRYTGGLNFARSGLCKKGDGTMLLNGDYTPWGKTYIEGGTLKLGKSNQWRIHQNGEGERISPLVLNGGTLAAKANISNSLGEITLAADSALELESGAVLSFGDATNWTADARLDITVPVNSSTHARMATVRFSKGLTVAQVEQVRMNGKRVTLDGSGTVTWFGTVIFMR